MDWTGIKINTAPAVEPVTLAELKTYMRMDASTYDTMLNGYITAARQAIEQHAGKTMITTIYELYYDDFPDNNGELLLIMPPVQSVTSIYYNQESDGVSTLLASGKYQTDFVSLYPRIIPVYDEEWPDTRSMLNAVKITYTAGYGLTSASVPGPLKECIMAICSDLFEHPEANLELSLSENKSYKFLLNSCSIPGVV